MTVVAATVMDTGTGVNMSRTFKTQEELLQGKQQILGFFQIKLPIHKWLVAYGRQSTTKQVVNNKESAQQQAIDLLDYGLLLGWPDNLRLLYIENQLKDGTIKNASGRLRIDERPGLQEVVSLIKTGIVGAVLIRAIDRLFRDETMVQPMVFVDICKEYHVIILTLDGDYYDFNNPKRDDLNRFILEAIKANDYVEKHVKGVMLKNRERKALRGEFSGHGVPTGLMLDDERKHYIANPLWGPVLAKMLKRYRELDGSFAQLRHEVAGKPVFPELPEDILKRTGPIYLTKVEGGYTVHTWVGLRNILINVALVGHTRYDGRLIKTPMTLSLMTLILWLISGMHSTG
jgi:DNA invertase Pin-like site-specific DNA recombinase